MNIITQKAARLYDGLYRKAIAPLQWRWAFLFGRRRAAPLAEKAPRYSVCVTTFMLRYETYFKPLIKKLDYLFGDLEVIALINGHYDQAAQQAFLAELKAYMAGFPRVKLICHQEPQGLSRLWNQAVERSQHEHVFIFNDDIDVALGLRQELESCGMMDAPLATNNGSWSQFLITKAAHQHIGPFDEGLKEIGGEDDDYLVRMKLLGIEDRPIKLRSVWSRRKKEIQLNSYGKDTKQQQGGYSTYNTEYLQAKWGRSLSPVEGSVYVRGYYWKSQRQAQPPMVGLKK